ncbi:conserved hypothetical protein [Candidatus Nitrosymbiomonas proteolyticus]|uniref:LPS-assembly protein LptD n=1 Tax=Candidatus Nitrosymbiomonas proteolyticus TaxID=2608984 RepID=A0A809RIF6_9BACT|nr:conserved hypothetical protein [Candidatus Nitrosymbiomonas proteolyticus]
MPVPLMLVPTGLAALLGAQQGVDRFEGELTVTWRTKTIDVERKSVIFAGEVKAVYGVSTVYCDRLEIRSSESESYAVASGNVRLEDPDARMSSDSFEFDWKQRTGAAQNVQLLLGSLAVWAGRISVSGSRWELFDSKVVVCEQQGKMLGAQIRKAEVEVGRRAILRGASLIVMNGKWLTLPRYEAQLDPDQAGFRWPTLAYEKDSGMGTRWSSDLRLSPSSMFVFDVTSYPKRLPSSLYGLSLDLDPARSGVRLAPQSDLNERFQGSFLDNVAVSSPQDEQDSMSVRRRFLSVSSVWNQKVPGFPGMRVSEPWQLAYAHSGATQLGAFSLDARYQQIGIAGERYEHRANVRLAFRGRTASLASGFAPYWGFDGQWFGGGDDYSWVRATGGLIWQAPGGPRVAVGYAHTLFRGDPSFPFDAPGPAELALTRLDWRLGPRTLSVLGQWDVRADRWHKTEVRFAQVAGCFEPFVLWREQTRQFTVGVTLRPLEVLTQLEQRLASRDRNNRPKQRD